MEYRVLGPLEVTEGDRSLPLGGRRQRLVLAVLLCHPNNVLDTDWLVDAVWGEHPPRTARKTLQAYLTRLRHALGDHAIESMGNGYALRVHGDEVDARRFEHLVSGGQALVGEQPSGAQEVLEQALALWRGRPYSDLAGETALIAEVHRLLELRLDAVESRLDADLALGGGAGLVSELEGLVAEHPHRERLRGQLMLALYRAGRQADALRVFEETRHALAEELGIDPGPDLADLHERILRHDPHLAARAPPPEVAPATVLPNPYKGLRTFTEHDRDDFFGRTDLVDELMVAVRTRPLVTVVGSSGSGKSSAVRAGLLPRLRTDDPPWWIVTIVPGRHPFEAVRAATSEAPLPEWHGDDLDVLRALQAQLPDDDTRALLVVDQAEELLTQCHDASTRDRFLANLAEVVDDPEARATVLLTLRADFVDQLLTSPRLGLHLIDSMVGVPPLSPVEIEQSAASPAGRLGVSLEPELLAELVGDMTDQPGALPLFEYALTETFDHRAGTVLTRATYRSLGGLRGALAARAETTYAALGTEQRAAARQVFLRLVTIGSGSESTRRTALRAELEGIGGGDSAHTALEAFDRARLLTFDRDPTTGKATVEIAHEALIRAWPRLAGWLDDARDDLRLQQVLSTEVSEWEAASQSPDYLLAGSRLARYDNWPRPGTVEATKAESLFLDRSRDAEGERRTKQRRGVRRLRALLVAVTIVAMVAAGLAFVAVDRGTRAEAAAEAAHARDLARASLDALVSDADLSVLLALEAVRVGTAGGSRAPEAVAALQTAVSEHRLVSRLDDADDVDFLSDGSLLVAGETTRQVDPANESDVVELAVPYRTYWAATSTDGELAATASFGEVEIWDDTSLTPVTTLVLDAQAEDGPFEFDPTSLPIALAFSDDHSLLVTMSGTGKGGVQVRSTETWESVASRAVPGAQGMSLWTSDRLRLSPVVVGNTSVLVPANDEVRLLDVETNAWRLFADTGGPGVTGVVGTTESTAVVASEDGVIRLLSMSGEMLDSVQASDAAVTSVAAITGSARVVTGDSQGRVRTWSVEGDSLTAVESFIGADDALLNLAVDADGALIAGTDTQGRGYVWHASSTAVRYPAEGRGGGPVAFSPNGGLLAVGDPAAPVVHVRDLDTGQSQARLTFPDVEWMIEMHDLVFCPDDDCIVSAQVWPDAAWANPNLYSTLRLDLRSGTTAPAWVSTRPVTGVAFSPDPRFMAVSTCHGGAAFYVLDTARSASLRIEGIVVSEDVVTEDGAECGHAVDITSDGTRVAVLATGAGRPSVRVHSVADGSVLAAADHEPGPIGSVRFSPDATLLLTAGKDGNARIWDAETLEQRLVIRGGGGPMARALWGPGGDTVVTSSRDGIARIWDAETGGQIGAVPAHGTAPFLAVSPDGRRLATSADSSVRLWPLDVDDLVALAESRVTRELTQAECDRYDVDPCRVDSR